MTCLSDPPARSHSEMMPADRLEVAVGDVAALAELGEDLELAPDVRVDRDLHVHVPERRHLPEPAASS